MTPLRILAWEHRRATGPLHAAIANFQARHEGVTLSLDCRPLSAFEQQGMAGAVRACDLIVYDHPFSGDIAQDGLLLPLDEPPTDLLALRHDSDYIGPSLASYRYNDKTWGAPIDAATQHAIFRADLLAAAEASVPANWQEVIALGQALRQQGLYLALPVASPHAFMTLGALMANQGTPWTVDARQRIVFERDALHSAMMQLREILSYCPADALTWNSIDVHEAMVQRDDIVYCPCVYGYACYGEADMRQPLSFADFAGPCAPFHAGSVLGGTAIGVSRHTQSPDAAFAFVRYLLSAEVQDGLIPAHHGQPATLAAWDNPWHNQRYNGFYRAVRASMQTAWIRPRIPGYPVFQHQAGQVMARYCRGETDETQTVDSLQNIAKPRTDSRFDADRV